MKNNITIAVAALIIGLVAGWVVFMVTQANTLKLVPYNGIGDSVLKNGTVLDLGKANQYLSPDQIIGHINKPGIWKVEQ